MLARNCPILTSEFGAYKLVQDLTIGELVYDPLVCEYSEVTEILCKRIDLMEGCNPGDHKLCPVAFQVGALVGGMPHKGVRTSPLQDILVTLKSDDPSKNPQADFVPAKSLLGQCEGVSRQVSRKVVDYYQICTAARQTLDVAGLLVKTPVRAVLEISTEPQKAWRRFSVIEGGNSHWRPD